MGRAQGSRIRRRVVRAAAGISVVSLALVGLAPVALADPMRSQLVYDGLSNPGGIAFAANGDIYVAGGAQNNVVEVDPTTGHVTTLIGSGLSNPRDVTVDAAGLLYIADTGNNALKRYDPDTRTVTTLTTSVSCPSGLTYGPDGNIYIADTCNNDILMWSSAGYLSTVVASTAGLHNPSGVAVDPQRNIYIADTGNNRMVKWLPTYRALAPVVSDLDSPIGLQLEPNGNVLIADAGAMMVEEWDHTTNDVTFVSYTDDNPSDVGTSPAGDTYVTAGSGLTTLSPYTAPSAPTNVSATSGNGAITVSFGYPNDFGGRAPTGYESSIDNGTTWQPLTTTADLPPYSGTIAGLTNGTAYTVQVRANNDIGHGAAASAPSTIPSARPGAPTGVTGTPGNGSISLSFGAPVDDGGSPVTGYEASSNDGATWTRLTTTGSTSLSASLDGLTNGTAYTVQVRGINAAGFGPAAPTSSVTPIGGPDAPTGVTATGGDHSIALTFTAPTNNGGSAITGYESSVNGGDTWQPLTVTGDAQKSGTITGLTHDGYYTPMVRALNAVGHSDGASADQVVTGSLPPAPTALVATPSDRSITVSFTPAVNGDGSAVHSYEGSFDNGASWMQMYNYGDDLRRSTVFSGLTNGTPYTVRLRSINNVGRGPSVLAPTATPANVPGAPSSLTATPGDRSAILHFTAPTSNGGSSITRYEATADGDTWTPLATTGTVSLTATLPNLTNRQGYLLVVRAVNATGAGPSSNFVIVTPRSQVAVAITGAAKRVATPGSTVTVTGTAPAGWGVTLMMRQRNHSTYVQKAVVTATNANTFTTSYVANDDYEYFVQTSDGSSSHVLAQLSPTLAGPASQVVKRNSTVKLSGVGNPGSSVLLHFHKQGTSTDDYSIVRSVPVAANGTWTRPYVADVDYRLFATSDNGLASDNHLIQAR